ncbi:porin [Marinobacter mobilis]|uniref:porin n=1 Tax=Marinobacter mobilis TaxID=488533 RepID=UPI0035C75E8A
MKKTLIASAIAAATFSGAAMAEGMPTVYGNIQLAAQYTDVEDAGHGTALEDNGSTLGVKHSHEIAPGIEGFLKIEFDGFEADDKAHGRGRIRLDEAYIGVKGDSFGKIWVGSDDSTYETAIDEIANYFEYGALNLGGEYETGEGDLIQYSSPSFAGLKLHGAVQYNGDADVQNTEKSYPYQLAATYEIDALEVAVAMDSNDSADGVNNENTYGLRGSYAMGDLRLTAQYQDRKDVGDVWGVFGGYTMGANVFALSYEMASEDNTDNEVSTISAQALHNVSDNLYVYVEGYLTNLDDGTSDTDVTQAVIGATYYF